MEARLKTIAKTALSRAPVFSSLPLAIQERFAEPSRIRALKPGETLWDDGAPARDLGLVLTGKLKVIRRHVGHEAVLDVAIPGELLGEVAFSLSARYQSSVVSLRQSRVLLVPAEQLRSHLESEPRAALALAFDLAVQMVRMARRVEDLSLGNVEVRLARVLLRLAERAGEPFPGGVLIPMRLRRADLAALAATTLESTSRKVSAWTRTGVLLPQPAGYLIKNIEALRQLASE